MKLTNPNPPPPKKKRREKVANFHTCDQLKRKLTSPLALPLGDPTFENLTSPLAIFFGIGPIWILKCFDFYCHTMKFHNPHRAISQSPMLTQFH